MIGNGKMFISHTHVDNQACDPLLAALDAWQVDYWFDLEQLSAGQEFPDRIERGIAERDIFLRAHARRYALRVDGARSRLCPLAERPEGRASRHQSHVTARLSPQSPGARRNCD